LQYFTPLERARRFPAVNLTLPWLEACTGAKVGRRPSV
jgi:hypothetical protein